jgi:hypothetical protein
MDAIHNERIPQDPMKVARVAGRIPDAVDAAGIGSVHHDRSMLIFHQRGVQLCLADRYNLNPLLRSVNRGRLKQRGHTPIGDPAQPFDRFVVNEHDIFAGRLNTLHVFEGERTAERNGGSCCPDSQSETSWINLSRWQSNLNRRLPDSLTKTHLCL